MNREDGLGRAMDMLTDQLIRKARGKEDEAVEILGEFMMLFVHL